MAVFDSVMDELRAMGNEKTRKTYIRHGIPAVRTLGVSVADLKIVTKTIKRDQAVACELLETGLMEPMYLAGMVADGSRISREQLTSYAERAAGMPMISEYTIPWLACDHPRACDIAIEWMERDCKSIASSGWCTYSGLVALKADEQLDLAEIERLLGTAVSGLPGAPDRVKLKMNGFVIAVGTYVAPLLSEAKSAAARIGTVSVDMGDTACKVPSAMAVIEKVENSGQVGRKKKTIRC